MTPRNIAAILLITSVITSCSSKTSYNQNELLNVDVMLPLVQNVTYSKTFPAYISAEQSASIVAKVNGTLLKVLYSPGQQVSAGQTLFIIDPTIYEDNVAAAKAQLQTAEANLKYAQGNYKMMLEAIKVDAVSEVNLLQAKTSVESDMAAVENAKAALKTAQTNLGYCYIKAPFAGRITKNLIDPGNYISGASQPVQLASLFKEGKMYANLSISNAEYMVIYEQIKNSKNRVSWSDSAKIVLPQFNNTTIKGKLDYISPNVNVNTGTILIRVEASNPSGLLKDGMYVKVILPYLEVKNALLVPEASITTTQQGSSLYILGDSDIVKQQIIDIGPLINDTLRVVEKGITSKEYFITSALLKVRNGEKVKPIIPQKSSSKH